MAETIALFSLIFLGINTLINVLNHFKSKRKK